MQVAAHPFALLSTPIGLDCAGAVQFTRGDPPDLGGEVEWLDEETIAGQLIDLLTAGSSGRPLPDAGYFSLSGAQPKIARTELAGVTAGGVLRDGSPTRVHQEDLCQALGHLPERKYENEGGPGVVDVVTLLATHRVAADVGRFLDVVAVGWLLGATDLHAKNVSVLLAGSAVRLAPVYDIASALPYFDVRRLTLAMRVDKRYRVDAISGRDWRRLARTPDMDEDSLVDRVGELCDRVLEAYDGAVGTTPLQAADAQVADALRGSLATHLDRCRRRLEFI